jgi:hypothetical protein
MRLRDLSVRVVKAFQARRESTIETGIELALRTPEEEEPVDRYRS